MAYLTPTARDLVRSDDWSAHTVGELYDALLESTASTLPDAAEGRRGEMAPWIEACRPNIEFLMYLYCDPLGTYPEDAPIAALLDRCRDERLSPSAKQRLFSLYLNTYLYKYIRAEYADLEGFIEANPTLPRPQVVDHFITTLVYHGIAEANPGKFLGFEVVPGIPEGRKQAFRDMRSDILQALDSGNDALLFRSVFLLMTYFAGSAHRCVHNAVTTLLGVDMGEFRELFFAQLPRIIEDEGAISVTRVTEGF